MRIHILGICGTFMGGLAMLAGSLGHEVTGSDANVYPPMSTLLENQGRSDSFSHGGLNLLFFLLLILRTGNRVTNPHFT